MATAADFMVDVRLRAPGVSEPQAELAILQAVVDFCERTDIVQERLRNIGAQAGNGLLAPAVVATGTTEIQRVLKVWYVPDNRQLDKVSNIAVSTPYAYVSAAPGSSPRVWYEAGPALSGAQNRIFVFPPPSVTMGSAFAMVGSTKPRRDRFILPGLTIPDLLYNKWYWAVVWGAIRRLADVPNASFAVSLEQASKDFEVQCNLASAAAIAGISPGSISGTIYDMD